MITVKVGSAAPEVWLLKTWLNGVLKPSPNLPLEMPFGPNTKKAVAQFQQSKSLQADGAVGALTWRELADAAKQVDVPFVDAHNRPTWDLWPLYLKNRKLRPIDVGRFRTAFSECLRDGNKAPGLETFLGFINDDQSLLNA